MLKDSQKAFTLLLWCCGFGKVVYWARTVPPSQAAPTMAEWDALTRWTFDTIAATRQSDKEWLMCTLSVGRGGFGIRSAARHSEAAYLASRALTKEMVEKFVDGGAWREPRGGSSQCSPGVQQEARGTPWYRGGGHQQP